MDTTERNILMCRKAEEIQELWTPGCNDFVVSARTGVLQIYSYAELENAINESKSYIWLPRQDQLQDIAVKDYKHFYSMLDVFHSWSTERTVNRNSIKSMEQLWLCFVMDYNFNKTWVGDSWRET